MRTLAVSIFLAICLQNLRSQVLSGRQALDSLIASERVFARTSVERGIRESFLAYFADDAIVFQPHPVNYKETVRNRPVPESLLIVTLDWEPIYADISGSADLGYTTGPYLLTDHSQQKRPPHHGFFFSVWKIRPGGEWKVVLDVGIRTPEAYAGPKNLRWGKPALQVEGRAGKNPELEKGGLLALERQLNDDVKTKGIVKTYAQHLATSTRLHRPGLQPLIDRDSIRAFLSGIAGQTWKPMFTDVSHFADLGYTYGGYEIANAQGEVAEKGYYARVWKRTTQDEWKIVVDVNSPLSKEQ